MSNPFERQAWRDLARPRQVEGASLALRSEPTVALATWWAQTTGGNKYWRCDVPARLLPGPVLQLTTKDLRMIDGQITMPRQKGATAIWSYPGNAARGTLMRAQQVAGLRVLIEVDDNYLIGSPPVPRKNMDWKFKIDPKKDEHSFPAHRKLAAMADGIIVTTEELARAYRKVNENVYVCRNSIDPLDWEEPVKPDDGVFRIGYAASHSHWFDANDVYRALHYASAQPNVEVHLFGLDPGWMFPYVSHAWEKDLSSYRKSLQILDVGLCPLREGPWAACKSDIKASEYAMSGALPIVAFEEPYRPWWDNEKIVCLDAHTPKDFEKHVKWAIEHRDGVKEIVANAQGYLRSERLIEHEIDRWRVACCR